MFKINVKGSIEKLREKFGSALRIDENGEVFIDLEDDADNNINNHTDNKIINNNKKDNKNTRKDNDCQEENIQKIESYCADKKVDGMTPIKTAQVWINMAKGCVKTVLAAIDYMIERRDVYGADMYSACGYITACLKRGFKASEGVINKVKDTVVGTVNRAKNAARKASGAVKSTLPPWVSAQIEKQGKPPVSEAISEEQAAEARALLIALGELKTV